MAREDPQDVGKAKGDVQSRPCTVEKSLENKAIDAPHVAFANGNLAAWIDLVFRWALRTRTRRLARLSGRGGCLVVVVVVLVLVVGDAG